MTLFPGVALVTGAASGIGRQTALSFAVEGCKRIALCDLNASGLEETSDLIISASDGMCEVLVLKVNMAIESEVEAMVAKTVEKWGRLDYAVNAAGILGPPLRSVDTTVQQFDSINGVNYRGLWMSARAEIRQMIRQEPLPSHDERLGNRGSIVNIASQLGIVGRPEASKLGDLFIYLFSFIHGEHNEADGGGLAPYCASKAAVISMTRSDAIDVSNIPKFSPRSLSLNPQLGTDNASTRKTVSA